MYLEQDATPRQVGGYVRYAIKRMYRTNLLKFAEEHGLNYPILLSITSGKAKNELGGTKTAQAVAKLVELGIIEEGRIGVSSVAQEKGEVLWEKEKDERRLVVDKLRIMYDMTLKEYAKKNEIDERNMYSFVQGYIKGLGARGPGTIAGTIRNKLIADGLMEDVYHPDSDITLVDKTSPDP